MNYNYDDTVTIKTSGKDHAGAAVLGTSGYCGGKSVRE